MVQPHGREGLLRIRSEFAVDIGLTSRLMLTARVPYEHNISEVCDLSIGEAAKFLGDLQLTEREKMIAERVTKEVNARLGFLLDVGLGYLTLDRSSATLSGGESQRIEITPGQVEWEEPTERVHGAMNVGKQDYEQVTVFLLDRPDAEPQPSEE